MYVILKKDIENIKDIELLVDRFYEKVRRDDTIGHIFNDIIGADWSHHMPIMYTFWNSVLFNAGGYTGNVVKKHVNIDSKITLQKAHYDRWLEIWNEMVGSLFEGEIADIAKNKAFLMINMISMKVDMARLGKNIM